MIVLLTDFGIIDPYVGIMKGVIKQIHPACEIIDLTHQIPAQSIQTGHFILENSYHHFPKNTVFCAVIDPGVGSKRKAIGIQTKNYYFIGPDNGIFSFLSHSQSIKSIIQLNNSNFYYKKNPDHTFHGRDIFAAIAAYLDKGFIFDKIGTKISNFKQIATEKIQLINENEMKVPLIHIDHFGNLIFSINYEDFHSFIKNNPFVISFKNTIFYKLNQNYVSDKKLIALFNSYGLLEIAMPQGNAKETTKTQKMKNEFIIIKKMEKNEK
ncbi:MAG: SAM-dependent chlorinase/fluorinase [Spirochaetes bacterium]|nr:SAM-dependent chlorinase/fluorinase [Spirochaetota bacterium]